MSNQVIKSDNQATVTYGAVQFRFAHIDPSDHIFSVLKSTGRFYELELLDKVASLLSPGDIVADVGANIGTHSIFAAGICKARVVAFEPDEQTAAILRHNVELNGLQSSIRIEQIGLGARQGQARVALGEEHNRGMAKLVADEAGPVRIAALDEICFDGPVRFLKIDVEGMEREVLEGSQRMLSRDRPVIALEAADRAMFAEIASILRHFGYKLVGTFNWTPTHLFVPPTESGFSNVDGMLMELLALSRFEWAAIRDTVMARIRSLDRRLNEQIQEVRKSAAASGQFEQITKLISVVEELPLLNRAQEALASAQAKVAALENQLAANVASSIQANAAANTARAEAAALQRELSAVIAESSQARVAAQALEAKYASLQQELAANVALREEMRAAVEAAGTKIVLLEQERAAVLTERDGLKFALEETRARVATLEQELANTTAALNALVVEKEREQDQQSRRITSLEEALSRCQVELKRAVDRATTAERRARVAEGALASYESELATNRERSNNLRRKLERMQERAAKLAARCERLNVERAQLQQLADGVEAIAASRRWKIGDAIGNAKDRFLLRARSPRVMDELLVTVSQLRGAQASAGAASGSSPSMRKDELAKEGGAHRGKSNRDAVRRERVSTGIDSGDQVRTDEPASTQIDARASSRGELNPEMRARPVRVDVHIESESKPGGGSPEVSASTALTSVDAHKHVTLGTEAAIAALNSARVTRPDKHSQVARIGEHSIHSAASLPSHRPGRSASSGALLVHRVSHDDPGALCESLRELAEREPELCHHVVVLSPGADPAAIDAERINRILVLSRRIHVFDPSFGEPGASPWRTYRVAVNKILLSFPSRSRCQFGFDDIRLGVEAALREAQTLRSDVAEPTLDALAHALRNGVADDFLAEVEHHLHDIVRQMCESDRRRSRQVGGLIGVLNYAPDLPDLVRVLAGAAVRATKKAAAFGSSRRAVIAQRRADTYLYLAFELSPEDVERHVAPAIDELLEAAVATSAPWPLLCRGLRNSFLKGLALLASRPALQRLVDATPSDDAAGFRIIQWAVRGCGSVGMDARDVGWLVRQVHSFSKRTLVSLARDLRRTVPRFHGPSHDHSEALVDAFEREMDQGQQGAADRETWMARCLLCLYAGVAGPAFLRWISVNHARLGLTPVDRDVLAAICGDDVPYIQLVNRRLTSAGIAGNLVPPPSRCTNVREFMKETLAGWAKARDVKAWQSPNGSVHWPTVSVIITTFKPDVDLLALSLRSVIGQGYPSLEIFVIDDCSPPELSSRIEACVLALRNESAHPIVYRRNATNIGQYASRNEAIAIAKGEFIAIQDDDDLSHPDRIRVQVEPMLRDPHVVATHAQHLRIAEESRLMVDGDAIGEIEGDAPVSFIWRKALFDRIGAFLPTRTRGDIEFRARIRRHHPEHAIQIVRQPLVLMRGGLGTVSSSREYVFRSAVSALRFMMDHVEIGNEALGERWIPTNLS